MKLTFGLSVIFTVLLFIAAATCRADVSASSWEQHPEGIALTLTLRGHSIMVDIKNVSKITKDILGGGSDSGVKLFYVDDQGAKILLGKHSNPSNPWDDITQGHVGPVAIPPGGKQSRIIAITDDELALVKTHPVVCSMLVYDPATKQQSIVTSSPKILIETVIPSPSK